jgi:signal transduction histidine kinase/ligand-binding sensor domain-containing protein
MRLFRTIHTLPFAFATALVCLGLGLSSPLRALSPQSKIKDFVHTPFFGPDMPFSSVRSLAQTQDGYLWLATYEGVFRFDGIRFARFDPLSKASPRQLLATRDGGLWVVFDTGRVSRLLDGKVTMFAIEEVPRVNALAEDPDGSIVAATGPGLSRFRNGRWQEAARALHQTAKLWAVVWFDRNGALWLVTEARLLKLPHGADRFIDVGVPATVRRAKPNRFTQSPNGSVWMLDEAAIHVVDPGKSPIRMKVVASAIATDRDGSVWLGNPNHGLWRIPAGEAADRESVALSDSAQPDRNFEAFTRADGLSGDEVQCVLEDREGNIWVGTDQGLDRFRESAFHRVALPDPGRTDSIVDLKKGRLAMIVRDRPLLRTIERDGKTATIQIGLPASQVCSMEDDTLWVVTSRGFGRLSGKGAVSYPPQPQLNSIHAISCGWGSVWVADRLQGVFRYAGGKTEKVPGLRPQVLTFLQETPDRVWIPYPDGTISVYEKGSIRKYGAGDGLTGNVYEILQAANGDLWFAGENALTRFRNGHFESSDVTSGLPVWNVMAGDGNFLWLRASKIMVRIDVREFDRALANRGYRPRIESYGTREGLPDAAALARRSGDRIWVVTTNGFGYLDATPRLRKNALAPPVKIETVTADGKSSEPAPGLRLPKLTHDLQIDYTALSLTYPEKVGFRYRLEGRDNDWQDVGARRRAYYTDLAPKPYSFRVIAANNDGVWNTAGAAIAFSIDPAWYQTRWFQAFCVAAALAMLGGLYRYRLHQMARRFNVRLEERVTERTRIARELHDTLLQSFQGLMLRLQLVDNLLPAGKAKDQLDQTLERADEAIAEARTAVYDLRSSATTANDLAEAFKSLADELAGGDSPAFRLVVEGGVRQLQPIIRDEIYRMAREALRNAFNHAQARRIETEITYGDRTLQVRIRDDGKGIPPEVLESGRTGHYGLCGMRERIGQVGGKLEIWSREGAGAEIELTIAGAIAYRGKQSLWDALKRKARDSNSVG